MRSNDGISLSYFGSLPIPRRLTLAFHKKSKKHVNIVSNRKIYRKNSNG